MFHRKNKQRKPSVHEGLPGCGTVQTLFEGSDHVIIQLFQKQKKITVRVHEDLGVSAYLGVRIYAKFKAQVGTCLKKTG